jgi:hypothetical protein
MFESFGDAQIVVKLSGLILAVGRPCNLATLLWFCGTYSAPTDDLVSATKRSPKAQRFRRAESINFTTDDVRIPLRPVLLWKALRLRNLDDALSRYPKPEEVVDESYCYQLSMPQKK